MQAVDTKLKSRIYGTGRVRPSPRMTFWTLEDGMPWTRRCRVWRLRGQFAVWRAGFMSIRANNGVEMSWEMKMLPREAVDI